ncbi:GNAT family N-acetyltransferase [Alteromonas sp. RKMC-009]|uniref:GNAT family N-acetyltransferase n=1 Tax=Alteromonas sp. RKMC-009 TaxID=2267264 RepID=UPI000E689DDA|nr:GNAT family N-acetyltransferase [Alteromonas sp. RKMC-009]AYA63601.1 GNAT family N-acetyltransferase [Alteromonas sp. RKMC-009]MEC7691625.1 GNAT family N-acetyltransferase [Pseudomonadota bacterium]
MNTVLESDVHIEDVRAVFLTADNLKVAASILYNAYHDDPLFMDIFQAEKEGYEGRLRSAIREELDAFWDAGQPMIGLFEDSRLLAVTCLTKPGSSFSSGRFWHWRLKMLLTAGYFSTRAMVEKEEKIRSAMPAEHYHMVSFIAVHPDHQHHGLGHVLMGAIDSIVNEDSSSEGVGVFVSLPKYLKFFRSGFYQQISVITVSDVTGEILFKPKPLV